MFKSPTLVNPLGSSLIAFSLCRPSEKRAQKKTSAFSALSRLEKPHGSLQDATENYTGSSVQAIMPFLNTPF